ncbi:MAG: FdhF/YdeP family oxidoreductase [Fimbriimonadaceae bacterium]|nr:FdhF/YdeP family oxidoreductase [Fimbriimonadaceae bacterium]
MRRPDSGGGWQAIRYSLVKAREVGPLRLWRAMTAKNACKTCALGMGGQMGGMRNEAGHFPEVCKKSLQAMVADMRGRIEPEFFSRYTVAQLQTLSPRELDHLGRLTTPLLLEPGDDHYRPCSWEEALDRVAADLRATDPRRAFFYSSGRSSNEAGFLMQLMARVYGTNHVNNCSYYCHQASGAGLADSIGSGTATVSLEDVESCDLLFLIGGNPASNHPRLMAALARLRERGGQIVVVNPVRELGLERFRVPSNVKSMLVGSEIASLYVQPRIGGDIAFLVGVAKHLVERGSVEEAFLDDHTEGWDELKAFVEGTSWEACVHGSGVSEALIRRAADVYAASSKAIFAWTMGITHHLHGTDNVQWIANLALMRGMVGKPGAGLLPIRGHSNVQGLGTVGVSPVLAKSAVEGLTALGVRVPDFAGYDTMSGLEAAHRGEVDFAFCLGGNLYGASPDAGFVREALARIRTVAYLTTTLNTGHAHGLGCATLVLPVLARDEEPQATTQESMFSYVRVSDGGPARFEGPRAESDVIAEIAHRALGGEPLDWIALKDHDAIRALLARLLPKMRDVAEVGQTKREFQIPGRVLREPHFNTPSGRARLRPHPLPPVPVLGDCELILMTVRSEGQFNTVVYEEKDIYRGQERRDVVLMHPDDLSRLGLSEDQWVEVRSETGAMHALARPFDIARGCALMYYPEANVLVPRGVDRRSRTPGFKSVVVTILPCGLAPAIQPGVVGLAEHVEGSRSRMRSC